MADKEIKITTLTEQQREVLKSKTPFILPDNPSQKGYSASQIKKTMYEPVLLLFDWLKRQGLETKEAFEYLNNYIFEKGNALSEDIENSKKYAKDLVDNLALTVDGNLTESKNYTDLEIDKVELDYNGKFANVTKNVNEKHQAVTKRLDEYDNELFNIYEALKNMGNASFEIVGSVEEVTKSNVIYLIKDEEATGNDIYKEYILIDGVATLIGDASIDLTNYVSIDYAKDHLVELVEVPQELIVKLLSAGEYTEVSLTDEEMALFENAHSKMYYVNFQAADILEIVYRYKATTLQGTNEFIVLESELNAIWVDRTNKQAQVVKTLVDLDLEEIKTKADNNATEISNLQLVDMNMDSRVVQLEDKTTQVLEDIEYLEAKLNNLDFIESSIKSNTNEITIPEEAQPIGMVDIIGGNTYTSENLFEFTEVSDTEKNGITYSVKNGVITLNGTATANTNIFLFVTKLLSVPIAASNTANYVFSIYSSGSYSQNIDCYVGYYDGTNYTGSTLISCSSNINVKNLGVNHTTDTYLRGFNIYVRSGDTLTNVQFKPMLVKGSTIPTTFSEGYTGFRHSACTNVHSGSDNLLQLEDVEETTNSNSVTYKVENGVITLTKIQTSSTSTIDLKLKNTIPTGTYSKNSFLSNQSFALLKAINTSVGGSSSNQTETITTNDEANYISLYISSEKTFSNSELKPMLVQGSTIPTSFAPYYDSNKFIPQSIQELDGYGLGIPGTEYYNYIDLEKKVFVQRVKEITLDGVNYGAHNYIFSSGWTEIIDLITNQKITNAYPIIDNYSKNYAELYSINDKNIPKISKIDMQNNSKKGIAINNGKMSFKLDDSTDNSENNWTQQSYNEYLKNNPISIVYVLAEPIETPIDNLDEFIQVVPNGTVTFENEYNQNTNNQVTVIKKVV